MRDNFVGTAPRSGQVSPEVDPIGSPRSKKDGWVLANSLELLFRLAKTIFFLLSSTHVVVTIGTMFVSLTLSLFLLLLLTSSSSSILSSLLRTPN